MLRQLRITRYMHINMALFTLFSARFSIPAGWEASQSLHIVPMKKRDQDGFGTLKPTHVGREEERGKKEKRKGKRKKMKGKKKKYDKKKGRGKKKERIRNEGRRKETKKWKERKKERKDGERNGGYLSG